jgi:integrase/recombinase XerD
MNELTAILSPSGPVLPALIAGAGERAAWRFLEFFTVNIRNKNTRAAYGQAAGAFLRWCEDRGIRRIEDVQPVHVAGYIEELGKLRSAPTVKQHLACIRMMFDWLVTGQVIATNPAHAVRGPRHSVIKGSTTVMSSPDATAFLNSIDTSRVVGLRDRALIAAMVFAFARVSAVVGLKVEDYFPLKKRWWLRLREKGGKVNEMGCHHKLEQFLDAYIAAAGIAEDKKGPLFRAAIGRTGKLSDRGMSRVDAWYMVQRVLSAVNRLIAGGRGRPVEKRYSFPVGISLEVKAPSAALFLARSTWPAGPVRHDSVYLTFDRAEQPRRRLGRGWRRPDTAPLPHLSARLHHRSWTSPQTGP